MKVRTPAFEHHSIAHIIVLLILKSNFRIASLMVICDPTITDHVRILISAQCFGFDLTRIKLSLGMYVAVKEIVC